MIHRTALRRLPPFHETTAALHEAPSKRSRARRRGFDLNRRGMGGHWADRTSCGIEQIVATAKLVISWSWRRVAPCSETPARAHSERGSPCPAGGPGGPPRRL